MGRRMWLARFPLESLVKARPLPFPPPKTLRPCASVVSLQRNKISTASTNGICVGTSRSLVFLWVCKRASQSTVVFSVSGIVELHPSITSRKTGGLEALLFRANTASRRILWWTWIRCFVLLFTSSLVWWRISWRRCTKMVRPSNTCILCSQVLVLLSSKRASLSDLRSEECWRILILRSFLT